MLFEDSGTKELYTSLSKKEADAHKESTNGWQPKLLDDEVKLGNMLKNQHKKKLISRIRLPSSFIISIKAIQNMQFVHI